MDSIKLQNRMDTIFINSKNSETSDPHRLLLNLTDRMKIPYKIDKFKISALTWNEQSELPDGSYSVSDIQDYFKYILKNIEQRLMILQ